MATRIDDWLAAAIADAERRGLGELKPLLESLARSTAALREADVSVAESDTESDRESSPEPGPNEPPR
jgi:hypothetical protein